MMVEVQEPLLGCNSAIVPTLQLVIGGQRCVAALALRKPPKVFLAPQMLGDGMSFADSKKSHDGRLQEGCPSINHICLSTT